jgi:hypothetical protein
MKIHIHFGAHKTATTFLQNFLKSKEAALRERGVAYLPLAKSRSIFFPTLGKLTGTLPPGVRQVRLNRLRDQVGRAIRLDDRSLPAIDTLVLSDENFVGPLVDLWRKGEMYPQAGDRLALLIQLFPDADFSFYFSVRDYADFCASAYCEVLRHNQLPALPELMTELGEEVFSWPELLDRVREAVGGRSITFWRYEDFRQSAGAVAEALSTVKLEAVSQAAEARVRPSLGKKAVAMLQACSPLLTKQEFKRLANHLAEKFTFEDAGGKFEIEDRGLVARLRARYSDHCNSLIDNSELLAGGLRRLVR